MSEHSHEGHRARLAERLEKNGLAGFHDYEVVELLLTYAIPRRDTKPLAKELLKRFHTMNELLNASAADIALVPGMGKRSAQLFRLIREMMGHCLEERCRDLDFVARRRDIEDYLRFNYGGKKEEYVAAIFLDNGNHVLGTEIIAEGTVNQCAVYPRVVMQKAIAHDASSVILVHNHPGGTVRPSDADWQLTIRLHQIGKLMDIPLIDHLIISRTGTESLRELSRWPG